MKLRHIVYVVCLCAWLLYPPGQTLEEAKKLYLEERFAEALPIFQTEYLINPTDASSINGWAYVSMKQVTSRLLKNTSFMLRKKKSQKHTSIWGNFTRKWYRFDEAERSFEKYRKIKRRDKEALARLEEKQAYADRLKRLVKRTEDIQIIDSIVVAKINSFRRIA